MKRMTWAGMVVLGAVAVVATTLRVTSADDRAAATRVERGRYLVSTLACHDCHTPKKMGPTGPTFDMSRALSGHPESVAVSQPPTLNGPWVAATTFDLTAWSGPWGISFAANLTPDQNTGTGIWTEEMFVNAIRKGRHMGVSRPILPPMPWEVYRNLTDEDLKSVYAYLRTVTPIHNRVPDPLPPASSLTN